MRYVLVSYTGSKFLSWIWYAECPLSKMNGFLLEMGMSSVLLPVPSGSRKFLVLSMLFGELPNPVVGKGAGWS